MSTHLMVRVLWSIEDKEDPASILELVEWAMNSACSTLKSNLTGKSITYKMSDTFSEIYEEEV